MLDFTPTHLAINSCGYTACTRDGAAYLDAWGHRVRGTAYLPAVRVGSVVLCDLLACTPAQRKVALRERARGLRVACLDIVEEARDAIAIAHKAQEGELTKIAEISARAHAGDAACELSRVRVTCEQPGDSRDPN